MHQGIYDRLLELARARPGRLTAYSDIAPLAGLSMNNDVDRDRISALLGEILLHEVSRDGKGD
jgi:alkylated DNA nucleotide flippase Atl1